MAYRAIETGQAAPRAETLLRLAQALHVTLEQLLQPVHPLTAVRFRATKRMLAREQLLLDVSRWLSAYAELERILGETRSSPILDLPHQLETLSPGPERAQYAAAETRKLVGLSQKETIRDICGLLEDRGIKVYRPVLASDTFFGLSVGAVQGGPAVVVNTWDRISVERWIFTAAHELGHILLHLSSFDAAESGEITAEENEADVFASYFLMPHELFQKEWDDAAGLGFVDAVLKVKRIFRVSWKTVVYRLTLQPGAPRDLWARFYGGYRKRTGRSLTSKDEPDRLQPRDFTAAPAPRPMEPEGLSPADFVDDRLARLVRKGLASKKIGLAQAAEILQVDQSTMRDRQKSWLG